MSSVHVAVSTFLCILGFNAVLHAQVITGTIAGSVRDGTGAVLPGASITVMNEDTGLSRSLQTDAAGRYLASMLPLGNYRVTASLDGFQTETRRGISITVGRQAVVDFQLSVGTVAQSLEVTAEAPLVDTRESSVSYLVDESTISELPLNGRDITQLILLNPGVSLAENSATGNAYVGFGKKFSIAGARGEDNAYLLDGGYINNMNRQLPSGPSGALLGSETVKEFQVLTNSFSAQYGRALGGVFNAVSKSGTNEWHGNLYEYHRNSALDARQFFDVKVKQTDPRIPPFRRNSFGGTFGGPLQKDRAFFFVAYEAMRETKTTTEYRNVPDDAARDQGIIPGRGTFPISPLAAKFLTLFPRPTPGGYDDPLQPTAEYIFAGDNRAKEDYGQGRLDYQFSETISIFGRLTASNAHKTFPNSYPGYQTTQVMNTRFLTLSETHILSPTMLNTARVAFNRVDPQDVGKYADVDASFLSVPGAVAAPTISPGGGVSPNSGAPKPFDRWVTNRYNLQDDMNWTLGGHAIQFGGMIERLQFNMINPNRPYGTWTWSNFEDFLRVGTAGAGNTTVTFRGTPDQAGDPARGFRQWFFALYVQDDWQITPRITLNLGVRWEPYTVPTEVNGKLSNLRHFTDATETLGDPFWENQSWTDFAPRLGFAWSPFTSGSTSVRGGVGLFYIPNDPTVYRTQSTRNDLFPEFSFPHPNNANTRFPDALGAISTTVAPKAPEALPFATLKSPRAVQWNINIQRQLGQASVISLGYTGTRGVNQTLFADYNIPLAVFNGVSLEIPTTSTTRLNTSFQGISYYTNGADSWYHGFTSSFQRRFAGGFQTQVAYTWSKALSTADSTSKTDSSGSGGGSPKYPHDLRTAKGLSGYHLDHVLSVNYLYEIPLGRGMNGIAGHLISGWQLSGIVSMKSGQPFNVTSGTPSALSNLGITRSPNWNPNFDLSKVILGPPNKTPGSNRYFDTGAFLFPRSREIGNVVKNFLEGPGLMTWDFSLMKNTELAETVRLQFRSEFFNILNRANFSNPSGSVFANNGTLNGNAGRINETVTPGRQIQLGLKLIF
ncbi:MAG TPA: TonB-dependent receptor [Terriglobia bacterium]|nr:TonB-dependent receptor [Terriglobia bacterium]